jgi:hypothetical protein
MLSFHNRNSGVHYMRGTLLTVRGVPHDQQQQQQAPPVAGAHPPTLPPHRTAPTLPLHSTIPADMGNT